MALLPVDGSAPKKKTYTADQIAASLAANPQASSGAYAGSPMGAQIPGGMAPPSPSGGGSGGANPFASDPAYLAALAAEQAGSQQADAALRAAQEAAIVGYGDPSIAKALGIGDVSENTAAAARANTLAGNSSLARLNRQRDASQMSLENNLAAHGIVRSGELGYQTGQIGQNYGNALYDTQQQLLSGLTGARGQALSSKQGLHQGVIDALMGSYDRYVANPALYGAAAQIPQGPAAAGATQPAPVSRLSSGLAAKQVAAKPRSYYYRPPQIH